MKNSPHDLGDLPDDDNDAGSTLVVNIDRPLVVITNRQMPDFDQKPRAKYRFDEMQVGTCFLAGNVKTDTKLKGRLYSAFHARKKKHPTEQYKFELMDNDLYVWKVQA